MKKDFNNMDLDIIKIEFYNTDKDNQKYNKFETFKNIKTLSLIVLPYLASIAASLIFSLPAILFVGSAYFLTTAIITIRKDSKEFERYLCDKSKNDTNSGSIDMKKASDYYTKQMQFEIEKEKYRFDDACDKFESRLDEVRELSKLRNNLNKEESMRKLNDNINTYYYAYKLPPLNFDNDWDIFCDEIYDHLKEQKREKSFYNFMSKVLKYTFLQAMVSELDEINIYHFIDTLSFLYSDGFFVKDGPVVAKLKKNIIKKISLNNKKLVRYW